MDVDNFQEMSSVDHSSDNDSWTILDDEPTRNVAERREEADRAKISPCCEENAADGGEKTNVDGEMTLDSLGTYTDEIPIGEDLGEAGSAQYIWSPDIDRKENDNADESGDSENDDVDDIEIIDKADDKNSDSAGYPPEELFDRFPQIVKGRTYRHQPNLALNLQLTATLVVVVAMVVGLGLGHFKGWSERLELQEQFADVREERMGELTDSLVSCMTGEEGRGGEDQDLDELVIRQLNEENQRLQEEVKILKDNQEDHRIAEELAAILRDRINDLLVANSDLEKEVARLRRSREADEANLMAIRESMNRLEVENDQLRMAVGKERYGMAHGLHRQALEQLRAENDRLSDELRRERQNEPEYGRSGTAGEIDVEESDLEFLENFTDPSYPTARLFHLDEDRQGFGLVEANEHDYFNDESGNHSSSDHPIESGYHSTDDSEEPVSGHASIDQIYDEQLSPESDQDHRVEMSSVGSPSPGESGGHFDNDEPPARYQVTAGTDHPLPSNQELLNNLAISAVESEQNVRQSGYAHDELAIEQETLEADQIDNDPRVEMSSEGNLPSSGESEGRFDDGEPPGHYQVITRTDYPQPSNHELLNDLAVYTGESEENVRRSGHAAHDEFAIEQDTLKTDHSDNDVVRDSFQSPADSASDEALGHARSEEFQRRPFKAKHHYEDPSTSPDERSQDNEGGSRRAVRSDAEATPARIGDQKVVEGGRRLDGFESFTSMMNDKFYKFDLGRVIDTFAESAKNLMPDEARIRESAAVLGSTLKEKWSELDFVEGQEKVRGLGKTLVKTLKKAARAVNEEFAPDAELWAKRFGRLQSGLVSKWNELAGSTNQSEREGGGKKYGNVKEKSFKKPHGEAKKLCDDEKSGSKTAEVKEESSTSWLFKRSRDREENRKNEKRSDWLFDRASYRKKFHKLSGSDWQDRKLHNKFCHDGECEDLDQLNLASINHSKKRAGRGGEKYFARAKSNRRGDEDELKSHSSFGGTQRKKYGDEKNWRKNTHKSRLFSGDNLELAHKFH